mgnify:CR=1 FL=1
MYSGPDPAGVENGEPVIAVSAPVLAFLEYAEILLLPPLLTYTCEPEGVTATPPGLVPAAYGEPEMFVSIPVEPRENACTLLALPLAT